MVGRLPLLLAALALVAPAAMAGSPDQGCWGVAPLQTECSVGPFALPEAYAAGSTASAFVGRISVVLDQDTAFLRADCFFMPTETWCAEPIEVGNLRVGRPTMLRCEASAVPLDNGMFLGPAGVWECFLHAS